MVARYAAGGMVVFDLLLVDCLRYDGLLLVETTNFMPFSLLWAAGLEVGVTLAERKKSWQEFAWDTRILHIVNSTLDFDPTEYKSSNLVNIFLDII